MSHPHKVKQGEHLTRIAAQYGFSDPATIWDHADNAELRERRASPDVLRPGDVVYVPDKVAREVSRPVDARHQFTVRVPATRLRLRVEGVDGKPLGNAKGDLTVAGSAAQVTTDGSGKVEHPIPPSAEDGTLVLRPSGVPEVTLEFRIGHLDPVDSRPGQTARLVNLGYAPGPVDGSDLDRFRAAVEEFQCEHGLGVDGVCGAATQAKLREVHGC